MHDATYTLYGKRYRLKYVRMRGKSSGLCDAPSKPSKRRILIRKRGYRTQRVMDDILHECLHACGWDMSEEWVHHTASDLAKVLWSQGFQVPKED